jgi:hypothetical protein
VWSSGKTTHTETWPAPSAPTADVFIGFSGYADGSGVECVQPLVLRFHPVRWAEPTVPRLSRRA